MALTSEQKATWDESRQAAIIGLLAVLAFFSNGTTTLRLIGSHRRYGRLRTDDWCMVVAVLLSDGVVSALLYATSRGYGLHEFRVVATASDPGGVLVQIFQTIWAYAVLNGFCFLTIKFAILLFYRRLFFVERWFRYAWWANLIYAVLWTIGSTLFYILQCTPIDFYWTRVYVGLPPAGSADMPKPSGTCTSSLAGLGAPIVLNTIGDLCILLLPLPILLKLHTTPAKRWRLFALFAVGLVATLAGFVRFALLFVTQPSNDLTFTSVQFLLWSNIEEVLGIVCANMPIIKVMFDKAKGGEGHTWDGTAGRTHNSIPLATSPTKPRRSTANGKPRASGTYGGGSTYGPNSQEALHQSVDHLHFFRGATPAEKGSVASSDGSAF